VDAASGDVAGENQVDDGALESDAESEHEDTVWTITESGALFTVCGESDEHQKTSPVDAEKPLSIPISGDKFQDVPAFQMLAKIGLAEIPNAVGTGIGIHFTTVWQVRYPADKQKSCARSFGEIKGKGKVSCAAALLECLLWAWRQHQKKHPSCPVCMKQTQMLEGAISVGLGNNLD